MAFLLSYVDVTDSIFGIAVFFIAFNPLFWNLVARWEHRTRSLTRVFRSPYTACYSLGAAILLLNFLRSHCFVEAMKSQPKLDALDSLPSYYAGAGLVAVGVVLVLSSFLALGFVGTFLGDYFGILMEAKVTCFPFSILDNPMYWGSTSIYLGWALMLASPAGLLLTAIVALCYTIALRYEGPFTEEIYRWKAVKSQSPQTTVVAEAREKKEQGALEVRSLSATAGAGQFDGIRKFGPTSNYARLKLLQKPL